MAIEYYEQQPRFKWKGNGIFIAYDDRPWNNRMYPSKTNDVSSLLFVVNDTFFSIVRCNVSKSHTINVNCYPNNTPTSLHTIKSNQNSIFIKIFWFPEVIHLCLYRTLIIWKFCKIFPHNPEVVGSSPSPATITNALTMPV